MIIYDLNVISIGISPFKTDPPPVVDADGILPGPIAMQLLQPVAGRGLQIDQRIRCMEHGQFTIGDRLNISGYLGRPYAVKNLGGLFIFERDNHRFYYIPFYDKRGGYPVWKWKL
jgi:hypothetical protein